MLLKYLSRCKGLSQIAVSSELWLFGWWSAIGHSVRDITKTCCTHNRIIQLEVRMKTRSWKGEIWNPEAGLWPYITLLCLQMAGFYPSKTNTTCGAYCVYVKCVWVFPFCSLVRNLNCFLIMSVTGSLWWNLYFWCLVLLLRPRLRCVNCRSLPQRKIVHSE